MSESENAPVLPLYHIAFVRGYFLDKTIPDVVRNSIEALYTAAVRTMATSEREREAADEEPRQEPIVRPPGYQRTPKPEHEITARGLGIPAEELHEAIQSTEPTRDYSYLKDSDPRQKAHPQKPREQRIPDDQIEVVRQMMKTMTDVEIGRHYGYGSSTAADFRRKHGLKRPKGNPNWKRPGAGTIEPTPMSRDMTTYTDEQGRTVTKCSPGYAHGVFPDASVKPKRGY